MYGVVVGQKEGKQRQRRQRDQNEKDEKESKKRGITEKFMEYVKRRLNPQSEEECEESIFPTGVVRHRPEPPGTLAQSTRFTTHEIKLMYRGFKQECPSGVVDEEAFKNIFCQFFPLGDATQYAHYVFKTIKHKQSGKVNFEEFLDILSRVARGSVQEKLSWVFTLYDVDGDGRISRAEMLAVVQAIYELLGRAAAPPVHSTAAKDHVDRIFHLMDTNCDGVVTPDELAHWCSRDPALLSSLHTMDTVL
ncbi:Kv channel-interacting protein 1-like isoform X1 [Spodoptera frugiperda]|uniref:Kv channel-interacting protein 1-like isoform X1 n=2 Tax=Spodoptera frugiperda TaxID=7108 RepID=A0A9R0DKC6_SPOFR|nr:Kv channel-interacting protein 1-like isoform X1 [Spodoptera frugiperda]